MKTILNVFIIIVTSLCLAASVGAQSAISEKAGDTDQPALDRAAQDGVQQQKSKEYRSAIKLKGLPLVTQSGKKIGTMKGVKTDNQTGKIHFFTFTRHDTDGKKQATALPYGTFMLKKDHAVLVVPPDKVRSAPEQAQSTDKEYMRTPFSLQRSSLEGKNHKQSGGASRQSRKQAPNQGLFDRNEL